VSSRRVKYTNSESYVQSIKLRTGRKFVYSPYLQLLTTSKYETPTRSLYKTNLIYYPIDCGKDLQFELELTRELLSLQFSDVQITVETPTGVSLASFNTPSFTYTPVNGNPIVVKIKVRRQLDYYYGRVLIQEPLGIFLDKQNKKSIQLIQALYTGE
jgi:hypothetical protein